MRTTVTLGQDVAAAVERLRRERGVGVSEVVNDLLRRGLQVTRPTEPFRQVRTRMGRPSLPLDDVSGLLDTLEGDDRRR
ncbi:MAG: ribbon-helix-helix protein, CopG family [Actinomycetota bacterium]|jgi:metal-responsive CopG/Arc/MetJ family transcriptional regulator|nr:ribbon-helix-helix protein, CopG family [Actinomycetota bacterium]